MGSLSVDMPERRRRWKSEAYRWQTSYPSRSRATVYPNGYRRLIPMIVAAAVLSVAVPAALAKSRWPSRATPMSSTLGWFKAINAHDRSKLLFYVAPSARDQMGWARPSVAWSKFTSLHCTTRKRSGRGSADVRCTFHESASPTEGNPASVWDVYLHRTRGAWLITSYGQG